jgi:hypothetical protein
MAPRSVSFSVRSRKLSNVDRYYLDLLRVSEGMLNRRSRLYLQSLAPTNPQCARVMGLCPFTLCVDKEVPQQWGH